MPSSGPTQQQRVEHGHCNTLKHSPAFAFYLAELERRAGVAQRDVCAANPDGSRDYHAGRLAGLVEAAQYIEKKYRELAPIVEVVSSE